MIRKTGHTHIVGKGGLGVRRIVLKMSFIYKYETLRGFIKGVVDILYLKIK